MVRLFSCITGMKNDVGVESKAAFKSRFFQSKKNTRYTFSSPRVQTFALPYSMAKHLTKNWSSTVYQKLTLTCKHFFGTYRILCIDSIINCEEPVITWNFKDSIGFYKDKTTINPKVSKVWLAKELTLAYEAINSSKLCGSIFKSTITSLTLIQQNITLKDFIHITPNLNRLSLLHSSILGDDAKEVSLGEILAAVPNLSEFCFSNFNEEVLQFRRGPVKILPQLPKLIKNHINIASIDVSDCCEFIQMHPKCQHTFQTSNPNDIDDFLSALSQAFPQGRISNTFVLPQYKEVWFEFDTTIVKVHTRYI